MTKFSLFRTSILPLFLILMLAGRPCFSQEKFLIDLVPNAFTISNRAFFVDSVIDNRTEVETIGVVQKGMANRQVPANLTGGVALALKNYFTVVARRINGKDQIRIIAVVDDFSISEKTYRMKETGFADVSISYCESDSGRLRRVYLSQEHRESGGMDVTSSHLKRILLCLESGLQKLSATGLGHQSAKAYVTLGQQWMPYSDGSILTSASFQKGIYKNYRELRSNSPSIKTDFKATPKKDFVELRDLTTGEKISEPFGFSDGKDIYINTFFYNQTNRKALYAKVVEKGRYFVWLDHYVGPGEGAAVQGMFGALGYAAAKSSLDCIALDLKTGVITPLNEKGLKKIFASDQTLLDEMKVEKNLGIDTQLRLIKEFNTAHKD